MTPEASETAEGSEGFEGSEDPEISDTSDSDTSYDGASYEGASDDDTSDSATSDEAESADSSEAPGLTFSDLGLPEGIVRKLTQNGVTAPFPIQAATIPDALAGKDILGRGRTGSGKTLSFGLPLLATLSGGHTEKKKPRGIILTPTRELAMQVADALQPYGDVLGLKMKVVCGGTSMGNQIYALERGVDILVATPGRPARHHQPRCLLAGEGPDRDPGRGRPDVRPGLPARGHRAARPGAGWAASGCSSPPPWRTRSARWSSAI